MRSKLQRCSTLTYVVTNGHSASTQKKPLGPPLDDLLSRWDIRQSPILILPLLLEGDVGIYSQQALTLRKELASIGIDSDYLHDTAHRKWLGRHGPVIAEIVIGLATSGAVAAFQSWLTQSLSGARVHVKAVRKVEADGSRLDWFEAEGSGTDVAQLLETFRESTGERDN
jgi:hypothetical protein